MADGSALVAADGSAATEGATDGASAAVGSGDAPVAASARQAIMLAAPEATSAINASTTAKATGPRRAYCG